MVQIAVQSPPGFPTLPYDTVDFGAFATALKRRAGTIIMFTILAASASLAYVLLTTPQFTAQGMLYLSETQDSNNRDESSGSVDLSAYSTQSDVETQIGLLTTGTLIEQATLETGLNATLRPAGTPPLTYWRWRVFAHGNTSVFVPDPNTIQVVNATLCGRYSVVIGPNNTYRVYARGKTSAGTTPILTGVIGQPTTADRYALTIQYAPQDQPAETAAMQPVRPSAIPAGSIYDLAITSPDVLADALSSGGLSVTAGGSPEQPTKLATLRLRWPDPYQAKQFINQLMHDYIATQLQWKTEAASVTENFVTAQTSDVAKKLAKADGALSAFQAQTSIVDPQQNAQEAVQQMAQYQTQRGALLLQREALQQLHDSIGVKDNSVSAYLISDTGDAVLSQLTSSLSAAMVQLRLLNAEYTPDSQDVAVQQAQVYELRNAINDLIANDLKQSTKNLGDMDKLIGSYQAVLRAQPAEALKVAALKRASDQLGQFYGLLTQTAEQAQISKAATIIDTRVVAPAKLSYLPTSPKPKMTVFTGALGGLFVGIIVVFLRHTLSSRYESEEQIRGAIPLPVYGTIPTQKLVGVGGKFFSQKRTPNSFSESFRFIKRSLVQYARQDGATVVLVISANEGDGKTTVAVNLAKALADDGNRTVLLDCDLYLSRLNSALEVDGAPEPPDCLAPACRPDVRRWPGEAFWVMPARAMPTRNGRLDDSSFAAIAAVLREEFDYIILDAPPLPAASDGLVLGRFADVILSVITVRNTERRSFEYHNELITALSRPHGLIINGAEAAKYTETDAYFMGVSRKRQGFARWFGVKSPVPRGAVGGK